jgi:hypothetical protein
MPAQTDLQTGDVGKDAVDTRGMVGEGCDNRVDMTRSADEVNREPMTPAPGGNRGPVSWGR